MESFLLNTHSGLKLGTVCKKIPKRIFYLMFSNVTVPNGERKQSSHAGLITGL